MSVIKPNSSIVKTDYDKTDDVLQSCHQVAFDLRDLVTLVEEQAARGLTGTALSIPPIRLRQLCGEEKMFNRDSEHHHRNNNNASSKSGGGTQQQQQDGSTTAASNSKLFSQALWDRSVHLFRLLRHLGKPTYTIPPVNYKPGELLSKIDQFNTELELLLLRSRSGKGSDDELCFQFVRGCCPRGASCSFSHSKIAVSTWCQRWASEHLRDFTHYKSLLKQYWIQTNPNLFKKYHLQLIAQQQQQESIRSQNGGANLNDLSPIQSSGNNNKTSQQQQQQSNRTTRTGMSRKSAEVLAAEERQKRLDSIIQKYEVFMHPSTAGAMLRFADDIIGPEALSVALDMIQNRDNVLEDRKLEGSTGTIKESQLSSIIVRQPIAKSVFDVICSMIDLNLFSCLQLVDLSKCDLGSTLGRSRFGKLGKVLRRSAAGRYDDENPLSNRISVCLGSNAIQNSAAGSLLAGYSLLNSHSAAENNSSFASATSHQNHNHNHTTANFSFGLNNSSFTNLSFMSGNAATSTAKVGVAAHQHPQNTTTMNSTNASSPVVAATALGGTSSTAADLAGTSSSSSAVPINSLVDTSLIASSLSKNKAAFSSSLSVDDNNNISVEHPLLSLNLEFNNIGPSLPDFSEFIASLQDCLPNLEKLSLAGNPLVYDGASRLFPSLRMNGTLLMAFHQQVVANVASSPTIATAAGGGDPQQQGSLTTPGDFSTTMNSVTNNNNSNNSTTTNNQQAIAIAASATTSSVPSNVLNPSLLITQNTPFCALQYLDVCGCGLGDRGVTLLCETVKYNGNNMKYLNVGWNGITADGAAAQLADLLRQKHTMLSCLRLDYSPQVGRRGAVLFSQAIKENSSIRRLDMRWCGIGDEGALAILDSLGPSRNTSLAVFSFDESEVDPRTKVSLDEKLEAVRSTCQEELLAMEVEIVW